MRTNENFTIETEEEITSFTDRIQNIVSKYLPWWPLFVILLLVSLAGAWIYLRYATPIYQVSATLLIKDAKNDPTQSQMLASLNLFDDTKNVENEMQVIQSRSLAKSVAEKLHLYAPVIHEGSIINVSAYTSSPIIIEALQPDSLVEVKKIPFVYNKDKLLVKIEENNYRLNQWVITPYGVLRFLPNVLAVDKNIQTSNDLFFSLTSSSDAGLLLLKNLIVEPVSKQSSVITFTYQDAVPTRGRDIVNTWISNYTNAAIDDKNQLAANTLRFVEDRLHYVVSDLDSVERNLAIYRSNNNIVDLSAQGQLFLDNIGATDQKITDMNMQMAVLNKVATNVLSQQGHDSAISPSTLGITDPILATMLQNLYESEQQLSGSRATVAANNPIMLEIQERIANIKPKILENIHTQQMALKAGISNLEQTNGKYNSTLGQIPQKERQLLNISRQRAIKNDIYTFLLQKREETALNASSTVPDSRIIDHADVDKKPVTPKHSVIVVAALALALFLSILIVEINELFKRTVTQRKEIEKATRKPIIAEIVQELSSSPIVIGEGKRSFAAEQFRQLRTSLGYLGINSQKKKILVTSSISGEGKSFICANLGITLALTKKKIIMIELDIRKPKLSKLFSVPQEIGITQFLIGEKKPIDIIQSIPGQPCLFIIPSGPIPPNPSELIMNGRLPELLEYLHNQFDYILIDTSPVGPVTDAYIISPLCDATLYVIRQSVTPKIYLKRFERHFKLKPLKNMALIFNGLKDRGFEKYGYGYGYGYTEEINKIKRKSILATN